MCGIFVVLNAPETPALQDVVAHSAALLRHRGPCHVVHCEKSVYLAQIGTAPLQSGKLTLSIDGDIYNYRELADTCKLRHPLKTDSEIILHVYKRYAPARWLQQLRGRFGLVLHNQKTHSWLLARDHLGIVPLYMGWMPHGALVVASELKALQHICIRTQPFPPGHYWTSSMSLPQAWYEPGWYTQAGNNPPRPAQLSELLTATVQMHTMGKMNWGLLLSGGLDSSIIAALAARPGLPAFTIGLAGSPDLVAAAEVAAGLGLQHHSVTFTVEEGLAALSEVIYHLETFNVLTIRTSVPMFLLARYIQQQGIQMVLSGDGANAMFAGDLYFHRAPSAQALYLETVAKLQQLHRHNCLQANKIMAACSIETRIPFLDRQVVQWAMSIHPRHKLVTTARPMEKHLLRQAFDAKLPGVWRRKEHVSGGRWVEALQSHAEVAVTDQQLAQAATVYPLKTPCNKEQLLYRQLFATHFASEDAARAVPFAESVSHCTATAAAWEDPSGRRTNMLGVKNEVRAVSTRPSAAVRPAAAAASHRRRSRHSSAEKL